MSKKVSSIVEFLNEIFKISEGAEVKSGEMVAYYRGESKDHGLTKCQPGIFRFENTIKNEHNIFKEFITLNPEEFSHDKLTIDKLTRMQHYTLPTRLLDITTNALLGLYFACENKDKHSDAVVYVLLVPNEKIKYNDSDTISVISNMVKRDKFDLPLRNSNSLNKFNEEKDIKFLLHDIKDEKPYFKDKIVPEHLYSIICVKPLQNNKRIIRQQGMFLLFGNEKNEKYKPAKMSDSGIEVQKIVINGQFKSQIIKNLEATGMTKAVVYPDMQTVAEYLGEKYK